MVSFTIYYCSSRAAAYNLMGLYKSRILQLNAAAVSGLGPLDLQKGGLPGKGQGGWRCYAWPKFCP